MKRSLRTAEERSSTVRNEYYYGAEISKKLKRSKEVTRNMEEKRRLASLPQEDIRERSKEKLKPKKTHDRACENDKPSHTTHHSLKKSLGISSSDETGVQQPAEVNENASIVSSAAHQCCPCVYDCVAKLLAENQDLLMQKVDALIESKINQKLNEMMESRTEEEEQQESFLSEIEVREVESEDVSVRETSAGSVEENSLEAPTVEFPLVEIWKAEELNLKLRETTFFEDMITYVASIGAEPNPTLKMFNGIFSKKLQAKFTWSNKGTTTIQSLPNILSLIHAAGRRYDSYDEKTTNETMKNALRNARAKNK